MIEARKRSKPIPKNGSQTTQHSKEAIETNVLDSGNKVLVAESFTTAHLQAALKSASKVEVQSQNAQAHADESSKEQQTSHRGTK